MLRYRSENSRSSTRPSPIIRLTHAAAAGNLAHGRSANWHLLAARSRERLCPVTPVHCHRRVHS
jgi:hypothetical protein